MEFDKFPEKWFKTLQLGNIELKFQDFYDEIVTTHEITNQLLDYYYKERG